MKRTIFLACIVALMVALSGHATAQSETAKSPVITLVLSRHYGFPSQLCRFAVQAWDGGGSMSLRCGIDPNAIGSALAPFGQRSRRLTRQESDALRVLCDSAKLFDGGHVGVDNTAMDGIFEILKFTDGPTVVLVTSGNATFAKGPRKQLLDWLHQEEETLRKTPAARH